MYVIDASAMLSWCFEDERAENADALLETMVLGGMAAPANFPLEIVNTLRVGERRKRINVQQVSSFICAHRIAADRDRSRNAFESLERN
jgi:predicted nucleic acid-binding protein